MDSTGESKNQPNSRAEQWRANLRLMAELLTIWFLVSLDKRRGRPGRAIRRSAELGC